MKPKAPTVNREKEPSKPLPDDFVSVARRLGADESKERFEAKLKKIARAKPAPR
jgi:hypothetical protein